MDKKWAYSGTEHKLFIDFKKACGSVEKERAYNGTVHHLFMDFNKVYDSVRREIYSILIEFGIPRKLVGLIQTCLNETYSTVRIGKNLFEEFPIHNGEKQGDALSLLQLYFGLRR
jgi:hypothetical protein